MPEKIKASALASVACLLIGCSAYMDKLEVQEEEHKARCDKVCTIINEDAYADPDSGTGRFCNCLFGNDVMFQVVVFPRGNK